ncbi:MAG TPA: tRNA dihydrouridine synthase DusB [Chitinophagaceae bacterium]|nr:tRNA dihydrouridine synthase DusB [Chitinophagaceae bacterium]MCC6634710.1 tRNA dihydrouridine synthase DusB [Chitinophagaceae bacterium]HMZ45529.1 tRNA dihydrouridine synthase DusB [Chitinophagaceae bacterium]HNF29090.1 tRNA dihydrouridine synthase DusB [Chitinophagaceae bacterium]HNM33734.1 tRNA dihydrouridine synthase DusB [Chitinophagaceae bacterium]
MVKIGDNINLNDFPLLLAPMEDVSDPPFRAICKDNGADLMYTEFISSEGLIRHAIKSKRKLDIFDYERPIGIQIFGGDEEALALSAKIVDTVNPDLVDINFGCPVKKVVTKGAGAGVLKDVDLMVKLTQAVVKSTKLPVTVKTRLGWNDDTKNIEEVAEKLQDVGIKALAIHGRTRCQMYKGEADWTLIGKVKNNPRINIPIFGNGDIDSPQKAKQYKERYGVDGIMIGRAAIGYPWIFREIKYFLQTGQELSPPTLLERINVCKKHLLKSVEWKGNKVGIFEMRRHYTNYLKGLPNIKEFRGKLVTMIEVEEIIQTLEEIYNYYNGFEIEKTPIELINYHEKCSL